MPLSRRYHPEMNGGEISVFGMDFSYVIPPGVGIQSGSLQIYTNTNPPEPSTLLTAGAVSWYGRTLYATISGTDGATGYDFLLEWVATDTQGNRWPRLAMVLCANSS
jgi:hypothetical protein